MGIRVLSKPLSQKKAWLRFTFVQVLVVCVFNLNLSFAAVVHAHDTDPIGVIAASRFSRAALYRHQQKCQHISKAVSEFMVHSPLSYRPALQLLLGCRAFTEAHYFWLQHCDACQYSAIPWAFLKSHQWLSE